MSSPQLVWIPLRLIDADPRRPYSYDSVQQIRAVNELRAAAGQTVLRVCRSFDQVGRFMVCDQRETWWAARLLGLVAMPVIVVPDTVNMGYNLARLEKSVLEIGHGR